MDQSIGRKGVGFKTKDQLGAQIIYIKQSVRIASAYFKYFYKAHAFLYTQK